MLGLIGLVLLDDLAYRLAQGRITHTIRRMGDLVLNLSPPAETPVTRLDLEPRVLFAAST